VWSCYVSLVYDSMLMVGDKQLAKLPIAISD
jgi:hypothetical protein